jgi:hypothetical protein
LARFLNAVVSRLHSNVAADIAHLAAGNCNSNFRKANCPAYIWYAYECNGENAGSHNAANPYSHK